MAQGVSGREEGGTERGESHTASRCSQQSPADKQTLIKHAQTLGLQSQQITFSLSGFPGEGNGNPLQYSCLENPMDS